jgi:hypothetical protein
LNSDVLSPFRLRTLGQDAEARVIACYALGHGLHRRFEIFMGRIDEKPFSQNAMGPQRRKLGVNGSVMLVVRTNQNAVPLPTAGFRWLNEQQHLTLEEIRGKPAEHSLGKEGRVLNKCLENPLVFERFHGLRVMEANRDMKPACSRTIELFY